jgi:NDP-sugar pyrophosphorylase family protein
LVWYVLDRLGKAGIRRASICANSDTNVFRRCLGSRMLGTMQLDYYADLMPRGPAGCVRDAAAPGADILLVVEAAVASRIDLAAMVASHLEAKAALTVVVSDAGGCAEPLGVYVLSRSALAHIPPKGYQDIKEMLIPRLYERGEGVAAYPVQDRQAVRVRDAASYLAANSWALEGTSPPWQPQDGYRAVGQAYVHVSVCLVGPVVIGPRCRIEDGATIVGTTTLGADSWIGADAVVSRAAIWTDCEVGAGAIVDHCVLVGGSIVEPNTAMRDTVCVPKGRATDPFDVQASYWALPPRPSGHPTLLEMFAAAGHIKPVWGAPGSPRMQTGEAQTVAR